MKRELLKLEETSRSDIILTIRCTSVPSRITAFLLRREPKSIVIKLRGSCTVWAYAHDGDGVGMNYPLIDFCWAAWKKHEWSKEDSK
ncbi:hypothetical protein KAR91_26385 [Candidatus Pacearchaeota archaeon]|nr:hypothetical protein [Candidatus Pacearchaeota archaeon]